MTKFLVCGAAAVALLMTALPAAAQVRKPFPNPYYRGPQGYTYHRDYYSNRPLRGYEGFAGIGPQQSYCSYRRTPIRRCNDSGCRVVRWKTEQYCY